MFEVVDGILIHMLYGGAPFLSASGMPSGPLIDPLRIATNAEEGNRVSVAEDGNGIWGTLRMHQFYHLLKQQVFYWSAIVVLFLLATMFFLNKSEKIAERKADILHKLAIVFLASSTIFLLSAVINVLDTIF